MDPSGVYGELRSAAKSVIVFTSALIDVIPDEMIGCLVNYDPSDAGSAVEARIHSWPQVDMRVVPP